MNGDFFIVSKYLAKHWNLEFEEIDGYKLLTDVKNVFGLSDEILKPIIIEWFSEFTITDEWWLTKYRKLKASWTPEMAQDLAAYHPIDVEAELTALLSNEITREIDNSIIHRMMGVPQQYFGSVDPANGINDVQISKARLEDDKWIVDVNITPRRTLEYLNMPIMVSSRSIGELDHDGNVNNIRHIEDRILYYNQMNANMRIYPDSGFTGIIDTLIP